MDKPSERKDGGVGLFFVFILGLSFLVPGLFSYILLWQLGIHYAVSLGIVALSGLVVGRLIIGHGMKAAKIATIASTIFSVILMVWVMWYFRVDIGDETYTTFTGFFRLKPQFNQWYVKSSGDFQGSFTNGAGSTINLTRVFINDTHLFHEKSHESEWGTPKKAGSIICTPAVTKITVPAGDSFQISLPTGCLTKRNPGEIYYIAMEIEYTVTLGNVSKNMVDKGTIRGPVE